MSDNSMAATIIPQLVKLLQINDRITIGELLAGCVAIQDKCLVGTTMTG